jgi:DNA-binding LacI/PurR family transcriptional regulator
VSSAEVLTEQGLNKAEQVHESVKSYILSPDRVAGERLVSIRKLAALLGVSTFPVHQALQRLQAEGYVDNRLGSGVYITSRHQPITMADVVTLCMDARGHLWPTLATLFMEALADHGRVGTLLGMELAHGSQGELIQRMAHSESRTVVVQGGGHFPYDVFDLPGMQTKTVIAVHNWASKLSWPGLYRVLHDREAGAALVAEHLWSRGHRNVIITGTSTQVPQLESDWPLDTCPANPFRQEWERRGGAWTAMASHSSPVPGHEAFDEDAFFALFNAADAPTAVFGLRDYEAWLTQGILLRQRPDLAARVEIMGYGNTPWSQASHVPFSTVDYDFEAIVEKAVALIDRPTADRKRAAPAVYVTPKLIVR